MKACTPMFFWAIHSASSVSVPSLYYFSKTPTHPLQAIVTWKSMELLALRYCLLYGCCRPPRDKNFKVAFTAPDFYQLLSIVINLMPPFYYASELCPSSPLYHTNLSP